MDDYEYIIWSNEHRGWWKPSKRGYTPHRDESGRYSYKDACDIVYKANQYQKVSDVPNETMVRVQSYCCASPLVDGVRCLNCGQDDNTWFDKVCETCGGEGEITTMEQVYPGEPHMAPVGSRPCPDCQRKDEDDDFNRDN